MYLLAELFPLVRQVRLPINRDRAMLMLLALMQMGMAVEAYAGHQISGTIVPNERTPVVFGALAALTLVLSGVLARRHHMTAALLATITFLASIAVGLLGVYFHLRRVVLPAAPAGQLFSLHRLIWAPPFVAPLMFALIGVLGLSAVWRESPPDSGVLMLPGARRLFMPLSKTRALFLWVGLAFLATVVSSVLDHARANFINPWLWAPTLVGTFAAGVTLVMGFLERPSRSELWVYLIAQVLMLVIGPIGALLHLQTNLTAGGGQWVLERLLRGAPVLAPLLFSNMGLLGLLVLLDPAD